MRSGHSAGYFQLRLDRKPDVRDVSTASVSIPGSEPFLGGEGELSHT